MFAPAGAGLDDSSVRRAAQKHARPGATELAYSRVLVVLNAEPHDLRAACALEILGRSLECDDEN